MPARTSAHRSGLVALVGRANVGKSTLLNVLIGQKLAIVSAKPHTTRHRLLGVMEGDGFQAGLLDTPGYLRHGHDALDAAMSQQIASAFAEADLAMLVVEPRAPGDMEQSIIGLLHDAALPTILVVNKVDLVRKNSLLPVMEAYAAIHPFRAVIPVSATEQDGTDVVERLLVRHLPVRAPLFPADTLTDRSIAFLIGEIVREKVYLQLQQEVPYHVAIEVTRYVEGSGEAADLLEATVYVDKPSRRRMLIGRGGAGIRAIGTASRTDIEALIGKAVHLELWVRVEPRWRSKPHFVSRVN